MEKYSFTDVIKSSYLSEVQAVSLTDLVLALALAFVLGLFIVAVYRLTYHGVLFSWNFALSLVLLCLVSTAVIITVSSNVVLSLGMVGALSIVRFRTAVKDAMDTVFMFWAIAMGIMLGAGYVAVSLAAALVIGVMFVAASILRAFLTAKAYMVIVRYAPGTTAVKQALDKLGRYAIRSESLSAGETELVLELRLNKNRYAACQRLRELEGVSRLDIISYNGDTML